MADTPSDIASTKAEGAMRTIGEISAELGIKPHILRYWEAQFDALKPLKRAGGRRYYRPQDVAMLRRIDRLLNEEGFTVRGARQYLGQPAPQAAIPDEAPSLSGSAPHANDTDALRAIRDRLAEALAAA